MSWVSAREAADRLGIKRNSLYAYVSRGWVRSQPRSTGREHVYYRKDIERLASSRNKSAMPHSDALTFGSPVLDSELVDIQPSGHRYRGISALELAECDRSWHWVAEWLWGIEGPQSDGWPVVGAEWGDSFQPAALVGEDDPIDMLLRRSSCLMMEESGRVSSSPSVQLSAARRLLASLLGYVAETEYEASLRCLQLLGVELSEVRVRMVNQVLVLLADHGLNAASFSARVAASTGADLSGCILNGLVTVSGRKQGRASERVERWLKAIQRPRDAAGFVQRALDLAEPLPEVGHSLYPAGDPRATYLLDAAACLAGSNSQVEVVLAVASSLRAQAGLHVSVDFGLVALCFALGLPQGAGSFLFAVARTAGLVAHALEQRRLGTLIRPTARYVGPLATKLR